MKRVNRILTFLLLALLSTTLAWGGNIATTSSTGGTLAYYSNEACTAGLNVDNVAAGSTVYVKATPDAAHSFGIADADGKVTFITAQVTTSVFQSRRASSTAPLGSFLDVWRVSDGIYRLTMPDDANLNVRVSAVFPNEELTTYLDANGQEQEVMARILAGTETEIGTDGTTTWYVAKSTTAAFTHWLWLHGDVNIILADGATMTIGTTESPISNNYALYNSDGSTGIYAQSTGSSRGKLSVTAVNNAGIYSRNNITIVGAEVEATTSGTSYGHSGIRTNAGDISLTNAVITAKGYNGIYAFGGMTISGSQVTATGDNEAGIYSYGSIIINGGQVTATGAQYGIYGKTTVTLGWTTLTDFIHASSYEGTVTIASGQHFVAYDDQETATALVSGTIKPQNLSTIAGKTLRPHEGYLVTVPDGVAVAATRQVEGATVSVEPTIIGTTPYYIYKEGDQVTLTVTVPDGEVLTDISYSDGTTTTPLTATNNVCSFAMPAKDITVSFSTGPAPIPYLDENGEEQYCNSYTLLTGTITNTSLADGWYVADGNVSFNSTISVNGDAHLILKDGAVVNVGTEENPVSNYGINAYGHSLSIYGQSTGENKGQLNVYSDYTGIYVSDASVTINGGQVKATGTLYGINASIDGAVTINGGEVTATGTSISGIYSYDTTCIVTINGGHVTAHGDDRGIWVNSSSSLTISGGQVTASGDQYGIYANNGSVTLGWTNLTDFIHASSYSIEGTGNISIAEGKAFITDDGTTYQSGALTSEQRVAIAGKKLYPYVEGAVFYLDENGEKQLCAQNTVLTGSITNNNLAPGWYVAEGNVTFNNEFQVTTGDVHLILKDNAVVNVGTSQSPISSNGIWLTNGYSLSIYAQSTGKNKGQLHAYSSQYGINAVSGASLTINGGEVTASGTGNYSYGIYATNGSSVTINDGEVTVTGYIGIYANYGGVLNISGGKVSATGTDNGILADYAGSVIIDGGQVTVTGGSYGIWGTSSTVNINSGQVTATGNRDYSYGIYASGSCSVYINGGQVTANGSNNGICAASGSVFLGWTNYNDFILANSYGIDSHGGSIIATKTLTDVDGNTFYGPLDSEHFEAIAGKKLYPYVEGAVFYLDEKGEKQLCAQNTVLTGSENSIGTEGQETWYVADGNVSYTSTINVAGDVHLILKDNAVMNVGSESSRIDPEGIYARQSLTIYAQSTGESKGQLNVYSTTGIYAENSITINGGEVTADGDADGILASFVTINGGEVTASGDTGIHSYYGNVNINGGQVTASGEDGGIVASHGKIYLGWTKGTDFIQASSYDTDGTLFLTNSFIDGDGTVYEYGVLDQENGAYSIDGKKLTPCVPYLDENGERQICTEYTLLDGTETTLGVEGEETWYVVNSDIEYTDGVNLLEGGNIHLILADGKTMSVQSDMAIWGIAALTIYGQANGTGAISSTGMIGASTITINGGNVSCITDFYAIIAMGDIVINGGTVYAEGVTGIMCQNFGKSRAYRGMELSRVKRTPSEDEEASCNITINGGQVTAIGTRSDENGVHGGIVATGDITLGWRNASDYIYTNGYQAVGGTLSIAEGKAFVDEDGTTYSGTIIPISIDDKNYIYAIDDKTLRPNIAVLKGDANKDGVVNVTDIMAVANYILNIGMTVFDDKAADVNGDNVVNVTDIMGIANIILNVTPSNNSRANSEVEDTPEPQ